MSLTPRFLIIVTSIVAIVDLVGFLGLKTKPEKPTMRFFIMMILGAAILISINIRWRLRKGGSAGP